MKIVKNLLLPIAALAILIAGDAQAMEKPMTAAPECQEYLKTLTNEELLKNYSVSPELKKVLDQIPDIALKYRRHKPVEVHCDGKYRLFLLKMEKSDISPSNSRVVGSLIIRKCARENNLAVNAPIKRLYERNGKLFTFAEKIESIQNPFSLKQIIDIYKTFKKTGYNDFFGKNNIFNTISGIAYFIDTEFISFHLPFDKSFVLTLLLRRLNPDQEAKQWLAQKIEKNALKEKQRQAKL